VSAFFTRPTAAVFIEFTDSGAHIASDERTLDIAIQRDVAGALMEESANSVRNALGLFAKKQGREQAICLLPARGVSIRRISLPAGTKDEIERMLPLQIDAQFPLSSEELAWGYSSLVARIPGREGTMKELLIAAVKKESLQQYRAIIASAGLEPVFGIAALAREGMCSQRPPHFALLEVGNNASELVTFDESGPATLRVVGVGSESPSVDAVLATLRSNGAVEKIFVSGKAAPTWSARISPQLPAEPLPNGAPTTAIAGLRAAMNRGVEPLLIHATREAVRVQRAPAQWRWAAACVLLLLVSLGLRYADPLVRKARLTALITELEARRAKLPKVDKEAAFLNFIHTNQPNYLDIVSALASAAQPGMKLDSLTISKRGELALRGSAQGPQSATMLRSKLIESGYFSSVVIDEQTPNQQNQQQLNFRMTAQLRSEADRKIAAASKAITKGSGTNKIGSPSPTGSPAPSETISAAPPHMSSPPPAMQIPARMLGGPPPGVPVIMEAPPQ
jgi:type II secretory pathway component PulL